MSRRFYCLQTTSVASQPNGLLWNRWRSISGDGADYVSTRPATEWSLYVTFTLLELFFVIVSLIISTQTSIYWNDWFCWLLFWLKKKKRLHGISQHHIYILGLLIVLAVLHRAQPGGRLSWPVGSHRPSGSFVLCCVLFAPSPLGDNSHSVASSSPGQGPHKFISNAPSQVEGWSTDLRVSSSELGWLQSHCRLVSSSFDQFFSSTDNNIIVVSCLP